MSFAGMQELYKKKSDLISRFVSLQNDYYDIPRDYGDGTFLTAVELHTLKNIEDNPGITVTEMAEQGFRTKGAISQIVKKLENRGYLFRKRCPVDGKRVLLHVNEEGQRISSIYKKCSADDLKHMLDLLMKKCDAAEIDAFFSVISTYVEVLEDELKR